MTSMQAALGLAQLERIEELIDRKKDIFKWYSARLGNIPGVAMNDPGKGIEAAYWMVSMVWDVANYSIDKRQLRDILSVDEIDTRPFFSPLSSLAAYQGLPGVKECFSRNPISYRLGACGINLPSHLKMTEADVDRVCAVVRKAFKASES